MSSSRSMIPRINRGVIAAIVVLALLPPLAANGEEVHDMDPEKSVIAADSVRLTVLYDNFPYSDECETAWGYSCLIEIPGAVILFDTGGHGSILMNNMERLGVEPDDIEIVVLSHEHGDHTGGLGDLLEANSEIRVFMPEPFGEEIRSALSRHDIEPFDVRLPVESVQGAWSCGVMGGEIPEQHVTIVTDRGPIVVTGCAHPGIVEMAAKAKELFGAGPLLVMGGWHLGESGMTRIEAILEVFDEIGVRYVAPSHCTGEDQVKAFEGAFGEKFIASGAGRIIKGADLR